MKVVFGIGLCARDIIKVLERYGVPLGGMNEIFQTVQEIVSNEPIRTGKDSHDEAVNNTNTGQASEYKSVFREASNILNFNERQKEKGNAILEILKGMTAEDGITLLEKCSFQHAFFNWRREYDDEPTPYGFDGFGEPHGGGSSTTV